MSRETELAYQRSAAEGADPISLLVILYDTLVGDLRRAATAAVRKDIQARCKESTHALLVLGYLESWINIVDGGALAVSLKDFYAYVRAEIMRAQTSQSGHELEATADLILQTRAAWQQRKAETAIQQKDPRRASHTNPDSLEEASCNGVRFACSA